MRNAFRSFLVALVATFVAFFARSAWGQVPKDSTTIPVFQIGSTEVVTAYCLKNSKELWIDVYQQVTNGFVTVGLTRDDKLSFTNKLDLDVFFQKQLVVAASGAVTSTNALVDKTKSFKIFATTSKSDLNADFIYFMSYIDFTLVKSNGIYCLPDLSGIKLVLSGWIPYEVPLLKWARIEVYKVEQLMSFEVQDPRYEPDPWTTGINPALQRIYFNTAYITSGYTGAYRMKITVVSGTNNDFRIFDGLGKQNPETPSKISGWRLTRSNGISVITGNIVGGDPGRIFAIQSTTKVGGIWSNVVEQVEIPDNGVPIPFQVYATNTAGLFRLRAVNGVPY